MFQTQISKPQPQDLSQISSPNHLVSQISNSHIKSNMVINNPENIKKLKNKLFQIIHENSLEANNFKKIVDNYASEVKFLKNSIFQLEDLVSVKDHELAKISEENERLKNEIFQLRNQPIENQPPSSDPTGKAIENLKLEVENLKSEISENFQNLPQLLNLPNQLQISSVTTLSEENQKLKESISSLNCENQDLKFQLEKHVLENKFLQDNLAKNEEHVQFLKNLIEKFQDSRAEASGSSRSRTNLSSCTIPDHISPASVLSRSPRSKNSSISKNKSKAEILPDSPNSQNVQNVKIPDFITLNPGSPQTSFTTETQAHLSKNTEVSTLVEELKALRGVISLDL